MKNRQEKQENPINVDG